MLLTRSKTESTALDHDYHRANIRPSVTLVIKTPVKGNSWRKGTVNISLKDGALEQSTSMRHSVELSK